jgi:O-antigen/teichoic acid export membrane protein
MLLHMSAPAVSIETSAVGRLERRPALAGAGVVSASMVLSGGLIYVFHIGAARALGATGYGQIAVLWAAMFLAVLVLFRPLEQAASRGIADRIARGGDARSVVRSVVVLALVVCAVVVPLYALAWGTITDRLFLGDDAMTAMLAVGIAAYGVAYVVRGIVAGSRWYAGYGLGLVADAVARLLIAAPLLFVASLEVAAAAVTVAGLIGGLVPLLYSRGQLDRALAPVPVQPFPVGGVARFAAPASAIAAADQVLVNCAPILVMLEGGTPAAAALVFAATMLVRIPVYVFQGLASSILPNLAHLNARDDGHRFRRAVFGTGAVFLATGAVISAVAAVAGPEAMRLVYGPTFEVGRTALFLLGAGVAFYLCATTLSQALLALECSGRASVAWVTSALLFVVLYWSVLPGSELERVSVAFAVATLVDLALLSAMLRRRVLRA